MDSDGSTVAVDIKNENEFFLEQESSLTDSQLNYELNAGLNEDHNQNEDDQLICDAQNNEDENSLPQDEDEDEEEDEESDDDITITINEINNAPATANNSSFSSTYQPVNLNINKRAPSFGPGGQVTNLINTTTINKSKSAGLVIEAAGQYNGQSIFDLNLDSLEDKPWRKPGADITDYFNYGFTEETWKIYCDRQKRLRNEGTSNDGAGNTLNGNDRILSTPNNLNNNLNQNGNNIVLRTFTNNLSTSNNTNLTQIKSEVSSINENSKYGGTGLQKKAGPPPGRKQFGQIEVINSGAQQANLPVVGAVNNQNPQIQQINNLPSINNQLQQQRRQPEVKENFIQVIGPRGGNPNPQQLQMQSNQICGGMPPPFNLPPIPQYNNLPPQPNQLEFNQIMQNQMNYPPPTDFMNQPPQIRFPPNQIENMLSFNDQQEPANRDNPLFRDQDQDDRRNNDYSHRSNRNNYSSNRGDYSSRDEDYRRSGRDSRDQFESRYRTSRDKDYESSRRSRSPVSRRSPISRRSRHDRSRSKDRDSRRSRERSKERRRDRYKDRDNDKDKKEKSRDHKSSSSSSSSHKRDRKIKEEPEND